MLQLGSKEDMMYNDEVDINNQKPKVNKSFIIIILVIGLIIIFLLFKIFQSSEVVFMLNGGDVTLKVSEKYNEPGFLCYDENRNLANLVEVTNNIVDKKPGEYSVIYKYKNKTLIRKVTILEPSNYKLAIDYQINNSNITNKDVMVTYTVSGESFLEVLLPNGTKSRENIGTITISANGNYLIKAYNIRNEEIVKEISITNIDKELPVGKCEAVIKNKNTEINVEATDNNKIIKYEYYDNNKLLSSNEVSTYSTTNVTSKIIMVKVYDEAFNVKDINCNVVEKKYMDPIKPNASDNVIFQADTETLKAYIIKNNSYYITRIWAMDAYTQLNKAASPSYGKELYKPVSLVQKAMNSDTSLINKVIIGFNTSGFYLKDTYDAGSVNRYSLYDKTAVGTIVINNGTVIRNKYDKAFKQWYLMGINKDNQMVIFEDNVASTDAEISNKQMWSQTVINSGIRNTFSFAGPVILNGQKLTSFSKSMPDNTNTTKKGLQLICQIDDNNFALFTAKSETRNTAINVFLSMGCKTATNLDGGGSVALFYKEKNRQTFTTVLGGGRELPEAGYFTE